MFSALSVKTRLRGTTLGWGHAAFGAGGFGPVYTAREFEVDHPTCRQLDRHFWNSWQTGKFFRESLASNGDAA